jgi:hypothetical protein
MKNKWTYDPKMIKIPVISKSLNKSERLKKVQFVFVIFKHCETKNYAVNFLKDHRAFGHAAIDKLSYGDGHAHIEPEKNETKFLGNKL